MGLARSPALERITEFLELTMKDSFEKTGLKQREVGEFFYAAQSWARERRVIRRLEYGAQGNKLLKVAAVVTRNTRRIRLYLGSNWPSADIFAHAMTELQRDVLQGVVAAHVQPGPATQTAANAPTCHWSGATPRPPTATKLRTPAPSGKSSA